MKTTKTLLLSLVCCLAFTACSSDDDPIGGNTPENSIGNTNRNIATADMPSMASEAIGRLEMPKTKGGTSVIIVHKDENGDINYCTEWDTSKNAQRWSCYTLNTSNSQTNVSRYYGNPQYPSDEDLKSTYGISTSDCFYSSGYDHGHILPSADRRNTSQSQYQTFFLTNMQPQSSVFNGSNQSKKGPWYYMETEVRNLAPKISTDTLFVVKGGTIDTIYDKASNAKLYNVKEYIRNNSHVTSPKEGYIPVPKYFFVAVLKKSYDTKSKNYSYKAFGFWFEHNDNNFDTKTDKLSNYIVNIKTLEEKTGIDFFCNLPDDIEKSVENVSVENIKHLWGYK